MLRTLMAPLLASIQLFAIYVLLHGHYGPGGGFVAGVLLGAAIVLPRLLGRPPGRLPFFSRGASIVAGIGVLVFAGIAAAPMLTGEAPLDYSVLPIGASAPERRSMGILLIEVGVMLAVAGAMLAIFHGLSDPQGEDERP